MCSSQFYIFTFKAILIELCTLYISVTLVKDRHLIGQVKFIYLFIQFKVTGTVHINRHFCKCAKYLG